MAGESLRDRAGKPASYQADIAHFLPAELTAFYISIKGIIPSTVVAGAGGVDNGAYLALVVGLGVVLALLFYIIMPQMLTISSPSQRLLYCITFLIWVCGIEVDRIARFLPEQYAAVFAIVVNLIVAIWSFGVPYIFRVINPMPPASNGTDEPPRQDPSVPSDRAAPARSPGGA